MTQQNEPQAATYKQLVAACPGIDPKASDDAVFIADCLKNECTAQEATELFVATLHDRIKATNEQLTAIRTENETLKAEVASLKASSPKKPGAKPVGTSSPESSTGDAKAAFEEAVRAEQAKGYDRAKAVMNVNRKQPQLREALLNP